MNFTPLLMWLQAMSSPADAIYALAAAFLCAMLGATWHLSTKLGDLRTDIKVNFVSQTKDIENLRVDVNGHEGRISDLERSKAAGAGGY
jgi:hypothetical protein